MKMKARKKDQRKEEMERKARTLKRGWGRKEKLRDTKKERDRESERNRDSEIERECARVMKRESERE